jgi:nucleotide-binding universal stress UspA family protein
MAVEMARRFDARVVLMSVYGDRPAAGSSGKFDERELSWNPAAQLREKGMGRHVLGSVPNSVTHNAPCSVLVVKTT